MMEITRGALQPESAGSPQISESHAVKCGTLKICSRWPFENIPLPLIALSIDFAFSIAPWIFGGARLRYIRTVPSGIACFFSCNAVRYLVGFLANDSHNLHLGSFSSPFSPLNSHFHSHDHWRDSDCKYHFRFHALSITFCVGDNLAATDCSCSFPDAESAKDSR